MSTYPAYSVYKDSGVESIGDIPEHWENMKLKFLGEALIGITYSPSEIVNESSGILVFRSSNVQNSKIDYDDCVYVDKEVQEKLITKIGDILICSRNGSINLVGKNALIDESSAGVTFGAFMTIFRSQNYSFLRYFFNSQNFKNQSGLFSTSTINQLTTGVLNNIVAPIPKSIIEQQQIAAFLDNKTAHLDTLIEKKQQMIGLLNEKRIALITQAVTKGLDLSVPMKDSGVEWLGNVPEHWQVLRLKFMISTRKGIPFKPEHFSNDGIPVVKASDIKEKTIRESVFKLPEEFCDIYPKAILRNGDLVLSTVGSVAEVKNSAVGQIGKVPQTLDGALLNQNTVVFSADEIKLNKEYLFFLLCCTAYREHLDLYAHGTANQASLNIQDMLNFLASIPPTIEQQQIADFLDQETTKLDRMINTIQSAIAKLQEYRTALITAAVTGKIDVRQSTTNELINEI